MVISYHMGFLSLWVTHVTYRITLLWCPETFVCLSKGSWWEMGSSWERIGKRCVCILKEGCSFLFSVKPPVRKDLRLQSQDSYLFIFLQEKWGVSLPITSWTNSQEYWLIREKTTSWTMTSCYSEAASSGIQIGAMAWWFIPVRLLKVTVRPPTC